MSQETIQGRTAKVRKSWTYAEKLKRAMAAQLRTQRLLEQIGLADLGRTMVLAHQSASPARRRRSG